MRCMLMEEIGKGLRQCHVAKPVPAPGQVLIKIEACGVCRTDRHILEGDLTEAKLPLIPGHQIVGKITEISENCKTDLQIGERIGVPWLGYTCGQCFFCQNQQENLCDSALFTGYQLNGGFAEFCVADARYCFRIPSNFDSLQAAPLLCAGLIGYRSLRKCGTVKKVGFYGFGASAHILCQICRYLDIEVYAFTRKGDITAQDFARKLGASWAGSSDQKSPDLLDAAIIFAAVGDLVNSALKNIRKGGRVVCAGIHMSPIPSINYNDLWGERQILSIANLTRRDAIELLQLVADIPLITNIKIYPLENANEALDDLRLGKIKGAAVLKI